jgi:hypothetical protein
MRLDIHGLSSAWAVGLADIASEVGLGEVRSTFVGRRHIVGEAGRSYSIERLAYDLTVYSPATLR